MKKMYLYLAMLAGVTAACDKADNDIPQGGQERAAEVKMIVETISGTSGSTTRATIDNSDASFKWSIGDHIAVHVSNGTAGNYVFTSDNGASGADAAAATANFTVIYPEGYNRDAFAVYPSTIISDCATAGTKYGQSGQTLDVTLPGSYTLAQVTGETSPCPMISTNVELNDWTFEQLCGLLRLTVNSIPDTAKRLEIDFGGKKVWGDFSIKAGVTPGTSVIETSADDDHDIIKITKDGTSNVALGETSLVLNIPLPVGDYSNISVVAYDAVTGGSPVHGGAVPFAYTAKNTKGVKKETTLSLQTNFKFTFKDNGTVIDNVRFVRIFSNQNKLNQSTNTKGPVTFSGYGTTELPNVANPLVTPLSFDSNPGDLLAFQVVDAKGKVYAGSVAAPADGYAPGLTYDIPVEVTAYTFTIADGKKVYFSPGDLGVDTGTYSFTEPFVTWGWGSTNTSLAKRVWFNYSEIQSGHEIYGVANWRNLNSRTTSTTTTQPQEWDNIIRRTNMNTGVSAYYRVTVSNHANCLLLPPDETSLTDIGEDLTSGSVTNYAKYLAKGFVLLISTGRATYSAQGLKWASATQGWYWALWNNMGRNRTYFNWTDSNTPVVDWAGSQYRMRVRYVHDVE